MSVIKSPVFITGVLSVVMSAVIVLAVDALTPTYRFKSYLPLTGVEILVESKALGVDRRPVVPSRLMRVVSGEQTKLRKKLCRSQSWAELLEMCTLEAKVLSKGEAIALSGISFSPKTATALSRDLGIAVATDVNRFEANKQVKLLNSLSKAMGVNRKQFEESQGQIKDQEAQLANLKMQATTLQQSVGPSAVVTPDRAAVVSDIQRATVQLQQRLSAAGVRSASEAQLLFNIAADSRLVTLQNKVATLTSERQRLASQYGDAHPKMQALEQQLTAAKTQLASRQASVARGVSPRLLQRARALSRSQRQALEAVLATDRTLSQQQARLKSIPNKPVQPVIDESKPIPAELQTAIQDAEKLIAKTQAHQDELIKTGEQLVKTYDKVHRHDPAVLGVELEKQAERIPPLSRLVWFHLAVFLLSLPVCGGLVWMILSRPSAPRVARAPKAPKPKKQKSQPVSLADEMPEALARPDIPLLATVVTETKLSTDTAQDRVLSLPGQGVSPVSAQMFGLSPENQKQLSHVISVVQDSARKGQVVIGMSRLGSAQGNTFLLTRLAVALASQGVKTLAIDANLVSPALHERFHCPAIPGLSDFLKGEANVKQVMHHIASLGPLLVLPCGKPVEYLDPQAITPLLSQLRETLPKYFQVILVDLPPLETLNATHPVVNLLHTLMVIAPPAQVQGKPQQAWLPLLSLLGKPALGVIANKGAKKGLFSMVGVK